MYKTKEAAIRNLQQGRNFGTKPFQLFREDREVILVAMEGNGLNLQGLSDELKADKEVVLAAMKRDHASPRFQRYFNERVIRFSSPEIQELCKGKDPIEILETVIRQEKFQEQLKPKPQFQTSRPKM